MSQIIVQQPVPPAGMPLALIWESCVACESPAIAIPREPVEQGQRPQELLFIPRLCWRHLHLRLKAARWEGKPDYSLFPGFVVKTWKTLPMKSSHGFEQYLLTFRDGGFAGREAQYLIRRAATLHLGYVPTGVRHS